MPKSIDVHFVQNEIDPTGMGGPPFPPNFGALANALYRAELLVKDTIISLLLGRGFRLGE